MSCVLLIERSAGASSLALVFFMDEKLGKGSNRTGFIISNKPSAAADTDTATAMGVFMRVTYQTYAAVYRLAFPLR